MSCRKAGLCPSDSSQVNWRDPGLQRARRGRFGNLSERLEVNLLSFPSRARFSSSLPHLRPLPPGGGSWGRGAGVPHGAGGRERRTLSGRAPGPWPRASVCAQPPARPPRALQQTFRGRPPRASTPPRGSAALPLPARALQGASVRVRVSTVSPPRVTRTALTTSGFRRRLSRTACARLQRHGSPPVSEDSSAQGPRPRRLRDAPAAGPSLHCSRLTRLRDRPRTQTPGQPLSERGGAAICPRAPAPREAGRGLLTLPAPSRSCPGGAVPFIHFAILSTAKEE